MHLFSFYMGEFVLLFFLLWHSNLAFMYTLPRSSEYIYEQSEPQIIVNAHHFLQRCCVENVYQWEMFGC